MKINIFISCLVVGVICLSAGYLYGKTDRQSVSSNLIKLKQERGQQIELSASMTMQFLDYEKALGKGVSFKVCK